MKTKPFAKALKMGEALARSTGNHRLEWQTAATFLIVCASGGETTMQDIEKQTGLGQSSVSRNCAKLGIGESIRVPGPRLVEAYEDPAYRRRKLVKLTPRGKLLADEIAVIMEA